MEQMQRSNKISVARERAVLVACMLEGQSFDPHDPLGELRALAESAYTDVVDQLMQPRRKPDPATYIGKGKVQELKELCEMREADVVIFDNDLSPSQIGNIEEAIERKVIDRSELILDIFAERARTHEAMLQVELAQLEYTYPRLRAMWSHLERIAGGSPAGVGTRGPGEQQLEIDRRIVQRRKSELKREIARLQGRKAREVEKRNQDFYTVGLVGYTNAGKSTLFNLGTDAAAYADDRLFATLSTRTRKWELGGGDAVMLSDTVGFVRDLPHHLVASFKATLEEAVHSDLLLVVLDVADPQAVHHLQTVHDVLDDIGANTQRRLLVLNKVDKLEHNAELLPFLNEYTDAIPISAATGQGQEKLIEAVREASRGSNLDVTITLPMSEGKAMHFVETHANVREREYNASEVIYRATVGSRVLARLKAMSNAVVISS